MSIQRGDSRRFLSRQARSGFTLVEILVVVAVLAVLTGILIPTVQYTRESARLRQCQNNLRQIGLAALAYESSQRQLPAGTLGYPNAVDWNDFRNQPAGTDWRKVPHSSFWIPLLPYLEQQSLSSDIHPALRRGGESLVGAGETIGRWRRGVRQRVQLWTVGGLARIRGDVPWMSDLDHLVDPTKIMLGTPLEAAEVGFGAMHPGQVAFVMVDGSTTAISRETDWKLLYRMAGIASSKSDF